MSTKEVHLPKNFSCLHYRMRNPFLAKKSDAECKLHYLKQGVKLNLQFESKPYTSQEINFFKRILKSPKRLPDDFCLNGYRENNSDIANMDDLYLVYHYLEHGSKENRTYKKSLVALPKDFVVDTYKEYNPDLIFNSDEDYKKHYSIYGKKEKRIYKIDLPKNFDANAYKFFNKDLHNLTTVELKKHYYSFGKKENRKYQDENFDLTFFQTEYKNSALTYGDYINNLSLFKNKHTKETALSLCKKLRKTTTDIVFINHQTSFNGATHYLYHLFLLLKELHPNVSVKIFEVYKNEKINNRYFTKNNKDVFVYDNDPTILFHLIHAANPNKILVNCTNNTFCDIWSLIKEYQPKTLFHSHEIRSHFETGGLSVVPQFVVSERIKSEWINKSVQVQPPFFTKLMLEEIDSLSSKTNPISKTFDESKITIGMCGALSSRKNYKLFIELSKHFPNYNFVWIGGEECADFKGYDNLYHVLDTKTPFPFYKKLDYFLLTSTIDPCPYVVLENLYLGNKVITFKDNIYTDHKCQMLKDVYYEYDGEISLENAREAIKKFVSQKELTKNKNGTDYVKKYFSSPTANYITSIMNQEIPKQNFHNIITYNPNKPLVYLHLYKTAGTTMGNIFKTWFGKDHIKHKDGANIADRLITCTSDVIKTHVNRRKTAPLFYGHFNHDGKFVWPSECTQFITTLRDPFDLQVSAYYYGKEKNNLTGFESVEDYILKSNFHYSFTNIFTKELLTKENYREVVSKYFIAIGSLKNFNKTIQVFSEALGKPINEEFFSIKRRTNDVPKDYPYHLKEIHQEMFPLEYEIYNYVNELYGY